MPVAVSAFEVQGCHRRQLSVPLVLTELLGRDSSPQQVWYRAFFGSRYCTRQGRSAQGASSFTFLDHGCDISCAILPQEQRLPGLRSPPVFCRVDRGTRRDTCERGGEAEPPRATLAMIFHGVLRHRVSKKPSVAKNVVGAGTKPSLKS